MRHFLHIVIICNPATSKNLLQFKLSRNLFCVRVLEQRTVKPVSQSESVKMWS